jgi:hypothetical protein
VSYFNRAMSGQAGTEAGDGMTTDRDKGDMTVRTPVLSVTYGAFSLTLEGFEDPFGTMRDVAEYFRTVLAEDRNFGTRPAGPRADALRRFAEGRFGHDVDAGAAGGRVHLRAGRSASAQVRPVPDAGALFDEDAHNVASGTTQDDTPSTEGATAMPAPAARTGEASDPLSTAFDEARADALPAEDTPDPGIAQPAPGAPAAERRPTLSTGDDEAAVERLISQTDSALAGAEAQRRHATFTQLKAAVAATRADADAGGTRRPPGQSAAEIARYRDVLAQSGGPGAEAPAPRRAPRPDPAPSADDADAGVSAEKAPDGEDRLDAPPASGPTAPLILAAEQRVIGTGGGDRVSPRRIDAARLTMDALFDEGEPASEAADPGFARFLESVAPAGLADMIDAAAAYLAHVDGMEDFPRPQLMRLLPVDAGEQHREDVMRCIGVLLRDGKLRRSRRGQLQSGARSAFAEAARRFRDQG